MVLSVDVTSKRLRQSMEKLDEVGRTEDRGRVVIQAYAVANAFGDAVTREQVNKRVGDPFRDGCYYLEEWLQVDEGNDGRGSVVA